MERPMQYAYEVYKQKSFSKAAEKLYISQPAFTARKRLQLWRPGCSNILTICWH